MIAPGPDETPLTYRAARRVVGLVLLLVIGWLIVRSLRTILLLFSVVFLIAMVLNPIVVWLQRHRVPRGLGVALILLALIALAGILAIVAIPPLTGHVADWCAARAGFWGDVVSRRVSSKYRSISRRITDSVRRAQYGRGEVLACAWHCAVCLSSRGESACAGSAWERDAPASSQYFVLHARHGHVVRPARRNPCRAGGRTGPNRSGRILPSAASA